MSHPVNAGPRRLVLHARAARRERQVVIVGEARSGTSLLYRTLLEHPVFAGPAANLVESHVVEAAPLVHEPHLAKPTRLRWWMGDDGFAALVDDARGLAHLARRTAPRWLATRRRAWWAATGAPLVLPAAYWHARQSRGVSRVVDKTPSIVGWSGALRRILPRADLVYIHRDPVEVLASYRRRATADPDTAGTFSMSLTAFADRWQRRAVSALRWAGDPRVNLVLVHYADLVADPARVLTPLCRTLGVDYDPRMLALPEPSTTAFEADPHISRPITDTTHDPSDWVTRDEADRLRTRVGATAASLVRATPGP